MSAPAAIGRFRVQRRLGAGGFATVWLAEDPDLAAPVALKILAENWSENAEVRRRFVDEARLLRRVDSDHLVRVYDLGELPDGRPYFVMTYADRGNLADRLQHAPPPWPQAAVQAVVDAVAAGLGVLHEHGVVHRDLKPSNVLLRSGRDAGEKILLGDLGIAKDLDWASGLTMPAGSDGYMAPEQRDYSQAIGPATDVHSLAITAAQLLGLGPPWPNTPVGAALERATATDVTARTPTPAAFAADLRAAFAANGTPRGPGAPSAVPPPPPELTRGTSAAPAPAGTFAVPPPPPGAGPPVGATSLDPRRSRLGSALRRLPVPARVAVAASAALVLVGGGTGVWWLQQDHGRPMTPTGGHVVIQVPEAWTRQTAVSYPGLDDDSTGARAGEDGRSVTVAYHDAYEDPNALLAHVARADCGPATVQTVTVGPWRGLAHVYDRCSDGSALQEIALGVQGDTEWSTWIEVRSVDGDPDARQILRTLQVTP